MDNLNTYLIGDNLHVLNDIEIEFDFCYIDPPYNTGRNFGDFGDSFDSMESFLNFLIMKRFLLKSFLKIQDILKFKFYRMVKIIRFI